MLSFSAEDVRRAAAALSEGTRVFGSRAVMHVTLPALPDSNQKGVKSAA
jgi:hypothetical protein